MCGQHCQPRASAAHEPLVSCLCICHAHLVGDHPHCSALGAVQCSAVQCTDCLSTWSALAYGVLPAWAVHIGMHMPHPEHCCRCQGAGTQRHDLAAVVCMC
jgi:hypothetical protein